MTEVTEQGEFRYLNAGVILGGPLETVSEWDQAFMEWSRLLKEAAKEKSGPLAVSFVFLVPGPVWTPEFTEPKVTGFRRKLQQIEIQIPLPAETPSNPLEFMTLAALDALHVGDDWAQTKKRPEDLVPVRAIIASLATT